MQDKQDEGNSVRPQLFKSLVGKGHSEFSSNRQQVGGNASKRWVDRHGGASE